MTTTAPPPVEEERTQAVSGRAVEQVGLSVDASGRGVPSAWRRAVRGRSLEDPFIGWTASIGVSLFALFLRLWHLGSPKEFEFDETYYAKDAWSLLHFGYAHNYVMGADDKILGGQTTGILPSSAVDTTGPTAGIWKSDPSLVVHPEVGKWLIAIGEKTFGMTPFGWRVSAAVIGALMVLVMCRLARRLTGSTMLGVVAGLLLSFDGLQFVLSRLALLDIFQAFFILCGVHCVVADREWFRARLARLVPEGRIAEGMGPIRGTLFRPWLLTGGVMWGLAVGTKWSSLPPLAAFGVLAWAWSAGARRSFGVRWPIPKSAVVDGVPAFASLVVVAGLVYVATWSGWLVHANAYEDALGSNQYRQYSGHGHCGGDKNESWVDDHPDTDKHWPTSTEPDAHGLLGARELVQSLRSLYYYHQDVETFHTVFLNCATHPYQSKPSAWPLLARPVGVAADNGIKPGTRGCTADADDPSNNTCLRQVLLIGTPALWWGGCLALMFALLMWIGGRDWRFGLCVVGFLSAWLPWLRYDDRPIFLFYAVTMLPFLVLAVTLTMGKLIGPSTVPTARRTVGVIVSGSFFVLVLANFAWFWPIFTNGLLTHSQWLERIWFSRWI